MKTIIAFILGLIIGAGAYFAFSKNLSAGPEVDEPVAQTPAYMLVLGTVKDRENFMSGYAAKLGPLYEKYGGEYIAIGGGPEILEGDYAPPSFVIGKWRSLEAAQSFWNSPEYEELKRARIDNDWGDFDVLLVPGVAPKS